MYKGEDYDGRVEAALAGWAGSGAESEPIPLPIATTTTSSFGERTDDIAETSVSAPATAAVGGEAAAVAAPVWVAAVAPAAGPETFGSRLNAHHEDNLIQTKQSYRPINVSEPAPGSYVFDFSQNMAGQTELRVANCPAGTVISLQHAEILYPSGLVHDR
jgi:hypothetical protein